MRRPHVLTRNAKAEMPTWCIFFDTETYQVPVKEGTVENRLKFGWAYFTRRHRGNQWTEGEWQRFNTSAQFWRFVKTKIRPKAKLVLFAHNMGFDAAVVRAFRFLPKMGYKLVKPIILEDPPTCLTFRPQDEDSDGGSIILMDSLNFFRMPLAAIGKFIGKDKLPMPSDGDSISQWDEYCVSDVDILARAIKKYLNMIQEWDLGNFQRTLPGQAFATYRHRFMHHEIFIDSNQKALALARSAYKGGRVEAFQIGKLKGKTFALDINSMFPYVMRSLNVPIKLIGYASNATTDDLRAWRKEGLALVAKVLIRTEENAYPFNDEAGRLVFPVGEFEAQLTTPEIDYALAHNNITEVLGVARYHGAVAFREYIDYFWEQRLTAIADKNESLAILCKLFLNSFYGKWGQSGIVWEIIREADNLDVKVWEEWDADEDRIRRYRQIGGQVEEKGVEPESLNSHPAIAAHVTAAARMYLWQLLQRAGPQNVFYVDTDSLLVNQTGLNNLKSTIVANRLGALKVEWEATDTEIKGLKDYSYTNGDEHVRKTKGIRKDAKEIAEGVYQQVSFRGVKGMMRAGELNRQIVTTITKHLSRNYTKGVVGANGEVRPIRLGTGDNSRSNGRSEQP